VVELIRNETAQLFESGAIGQIRDKAKELLDSGKVECFIGYEKSYDGINARPAFIYNSEEVEKLVLDNACIHNLVKYLLNRKGKSTGIVVKPCDSRAINLLIAEKQIQREDIFIVGVVCNGVLQSQDDKETDKLKSTCQRCVLRMPVIYDFLIGEPVEEAANAIPAYPAVTEVEGKSVAERLEFWRAHFERCIRCYACRAVCPGCFCTECFVDSLDPEWVGNRIAPSENKMWHIIRAFHLAGRCVGCNACEQACPVGIPLSLLNRKLDKEVFRLFDFQAGLDAETPMPLATFKKEENLGVEE
jgi:ferredoxin